MITHNSVTQDTNVSASHNIPALFDHADQLLFKERKFAEAEVLYRRILEIDPANVDAINSIAYCVKFTAASTSTTLPDNLFETLLGLYQQALKIDGSDIEANFNLGLLYLQFNQETSLALDAFQKCVSRNEDDETRELFRAQFAKSYYNIGMIYDKQGAIQQASDNYKSAIDTCEQDSKDQLVKSATYKKAGTNYAVTLEKLNKRDEAVKTLFKLKATFNNEVRIFNNLGII